MEIKPAKSKSHLFKKGHVQHLTKSKVNGQVIPTVSEQPTSLGKWFTSTLNDQNGINKVRVQAKEWMERAEKSGILSKSKAWCYQQCCYTVGIQQKQGEHNYGSQSLTKCFQCGPVQFMKQVNYNPN
jgi:hypothetical protein